MEKKIRIFLNKNLNEQSEIILSKDQSHYLLSVMRLKVGQKVLFFNGNDGEFYGIINSIEKKKTTIKILSKEREVNDQQKVVLAFCPPKGNKLDFLIQKSTEIGVKEFIPVISDHTINRKINIDRLKKIIIESAEQSNQIQLPNLQNPLSFDSFVNNFSKSTILFADINSLNSSLEEIIEKKQSNYILFIGPEGDFSSKEREVILQNKNFKSFSLGSTILRSETAAIAGLVLVNHYLN
ncbi:MAG: RsmE family RNA methyltransferase [Pelagibacteraceae bacterium]